MSHQLTEQFGRREIVSMTSLPGNGIPSGGACQRGAAAAGNTMRKPKKRKLRLFARPVMPPARFHTTKHGKRGYLRREIRKDERRAKDDLGE
jgi:hypothetical protein